MRSRHADKRDLDISSNDARLGSVCRIVFFKKGRQVNERKHWRIGSPRLSTQAGGRHALMHVHLDAYLFPGGGGHCLWITSEALSRLLPGDSHSLQGLSGMGTCTTRSSSRVPVSDIPSGG